MNETITKYIAEERARGVADDAIRTALLAKGWKVEDVNAAFGAGQSVNIIPNLASDTSGFTFKKLFQGRLDRTNFFFGSIVSVLLNILGNLFNNYILSFIIIIFLIIFGVSITIRRWHDLNRSGWMTLLLLIPIANFCITIYLWFKKGDQVPNRFGPVPDPNRHYLNATLNM